MSKKIVQEETYEPKKEQHIFTSRNKIYLSRGYRIGSRYVWSSDNVRVDMNWGEKKEMSMGPVGQSRFWGVRPKPATTFPVVSGLVNVPLAL